MHPDNHHLSDTLLSHIEASDTYKVAFGFNKGDVGSVPTGGKKIIDLHHEIARKIWIDVADPEYKDDDMEQLKDLVKHRITA
jgi:hypothetical protein